ncbi:hypothetical protein DM02DRAFT_625972 [Periconia macrospinosa]|uniref:Uncharacterized protein n=1 Tax=Periconia macrospinosa TaxID=97972 RepID=A0A2V1DYI6_9PLEO|nr:hypothetical protein DM02DRAFT_625972 [Periconia macrospinosa]
MLLNWMVYTTGLPQGPLQEQYSQGRPAIAAAHAEPHIQYLPKYGHLLCAPCRTALPLPRLHTHLLLRHHIREPRRSAIVARYEGLPVSQSDDDIRPLPDGSPLLEFLAPPAQGFACQCSFKTISCDGYRKHLKKVHNESWTSAKRKVAECFLQKWAPPKSSFPYQYWRVDATSIGPAGQAEKCGDLQQQNGRDVTGTPEVTGDPELDAVLKMEAEEEARLACIGQKEMTIAEELEHDENTDWLRGCGWPRWFAYKPLHLIALTARIPSPRSEDYCLGSWNCVEWREFVRYS